MALWCWILHWHCFDIVEIVNDMRGMLVLCLVKWRSRTQFQTGKRSPCSPSRPAIGGEAVLLQDAAHLWLAGPQLRLQRPLHHGERGLRDEDLAQQSVAAAAQLGGGVTSRCVGVGSVAIFLCRLIFKGDQFHDNRTEGETGEVGARGWCNDDWIGTKSSTPKKNFSLKFKTIQSGASLEKLRIFLNCSSFRHPYGEPPHL